jgi:hypothetical protein
MKKLITAIVIAAGLAAGASSTAYAAFGCGTGFKPGWHGQCVPNKSTRVIYRPVYHRPVYRPVYHRPVYHRPVFHATVVIGGGYHRCPARQRWSSGHCHF